MKVAYMYIRRQASPAAAKPSKFTDFCSVYFAKSRGGNRDLNYNLRVTRTSLSAVMPTIIISSTQNKITPWTPSRYAHNTNFHHPKTSYSVGSELAQPENYPVVSFLQYTFKPDAHQ